MSKPMMRTFEGACAMKSRLARVGVFLFVVFLAVAATSCNSSPGSSEASGQSKAAISLNITLSNEVGHLVSDGNGLRRAYYAYDTRGRTIATQHVMDGTSYVFSST